MLTALHRHLVAAGNIAAQVAPSLSPGSRCLSFQGSEALSSLGLCIPATGQGSLRGSDVSSVCSEPTGAAPFSGFGPAHPAHPWSPVLLTRQSWRQVHLPSDPGRPRDPCASCCAPTDHTEGRRRLALPRLPSHSTLTARQLSPGSLPRVPLPSASWREDRALSARADLLQQLVTLSAPVGANRAPA